MSGFLQNLSLVSVINILTGCLEIKLLCLKEKQEIDSNLTRHLHQNRFGPSQKFGLKDKGHVY